MFDALALYNAIYKTHNYIKKILKAHLLNNMYMYMYELFGLQDQFMTMQILIKIQDRFLSINLDKNRLHI